MSTEPTVRTRIQTVIIVKDELGEFEFPANSSLDTEVLGGLSEMIDHCWDVVTSKDSVRYAVFALLTDYFNLEQGRDGHGDRLTRAMFDGTYRM